MSRKNLKRAAAVLGAATTLVGSAAGVASAEGKEANLGPYKCAISLPLLGEDDPIAVGGLLCEGPLKGQGNHGQKPPTHPPADHGSDTGQTPGDNGGDDDGADDGTGNDGSGTGPGNDGTDPGDSDNTGGTGTGDSGNTPGDDGTGSGNGGGNTGNGTGGIGQGHPGNAHHGHGHGAGSGNDDGNADTGHAVVPSARHSSSATPAQDTVQLAHTGGGDANGALLAAGGGMIALGAGAVMYRRRRSA